MEAIINPKDIERIRKQVGLTQKQLAKLSRVSQSLVAKIERGDVDPSFSKIRAISNVLLSRLITNTKKVSDIMSKNLIYAIPHEKVKDVAKKMVENGISQVPVINDNRVVGSITEELILQKVVNEKDKTRIYEQTVDKIMAPPFPIIPSDTPIEFILPLLINFQALLVSENGKIQGIITKSDILKLS
jgi:Predicted transcriptional regulator with C-terminal CBS domains